MTNHATQRAAAAVSTFLALGACRFGFDSGNDGRRDALDDEDDASTDDDAMPTDGMTVDLPPNAITVSFGERASATFQGVTADTYISNEVGEPTFNYGASDELRSESDVSERILLRFDTSAIPTSATVIGAAIDVEIVNEAAGDLEVRQIFESWTEGTLDGAAGVANFTLRNTGESWTNAGCGTPSSAGPALALIDPSITGPVSTALPTTVVQTWVSTPAQNFGIILYNTDTNSARIASREDTTQFRPLLTVTYVP